MVHYEKRLFPLLIILLLTFTIYIEARESKFFSKTTRNTDETHDVVIDAPLLAPAPAPERVPLVSGEGYGLYGHVSDSGESNEIEAENISQSHNQEEARYPYNYKGYESNNYNGNYNYRYGNNGYVNKGYNNNNEYLNENLGASDTRFSENGKYHNNVETNNVETVNNYDNGHSLEGGIRGKREGYNGNSENDGYVNEKLGMSDTRFSDNGKYYNNVENVANYDNGFEAERGVNKNGENEFDTMEEYEKRLGYSEVKGEINAP